MASHSRTPATATSLSRVSAAREADVVAAGCTESPRAGAAIHTSADGRSQLAREADLKAAIGRGDGAICVYIPPRHGGAGFANFRNEYSIYTVRRAGNRMTRDNVLTPDANRGRWMRRPCARASGTRTA